MSVREISGWGKYYETKSTQVLAAKLMKRNMKAVAKAISARLDTVQGSVQVFADSIVWKHSRIGEQEMTLRRGQYIVMTNAWVVAIPAHEFKWKYNEITPSMPAYYTPTDNEVKIIRALTSDEYYYGYDYICDETELDRAAAKEAIDKLRMIGVVRFTRGLMNEDGEVCGSGFGIENDTRAEALLYRYYLNKGEAPE